MFELLERLDVDVDVGGVFIWNDGQSEVVRIDHREHDGLSAAEVLLTQAGYKVEAPDRAPAAPGDARWREWPGIWRRFRGEFADRQVPWRKEFPHEGKVPPLATDDENFAWIEWDRRRSDAIIEACRTRRISLNALMLWGLSRTVADLVGDEMTELPWIMPVDLRRRGLAANDDAVATSGVMLDVGREATPEQVHSQLVAKIAGKTHLAYWWITERLPMLVPKSILWPILKSKEQGGNRCMGGCTYLGDLDDWVAEERTDRSIESAIGFNLLSRQFPVQSVGARWAGKLTFSLRLHPFIWAGDVGQLAQSWRETIESEVDAPSDRTPR